MGGIVGIAGRSGIAAGLLDALEGLEPSGYERAGIAGFHDSALDRRAAARVADLAHDVGLREFPGVSGIGHTRWSSLAVADDARPHADARVALVRTGFIANAASLCGDGPAQEPAASDAEAALRLISAALAEGMTPRDATGAALRRCEGAFALVLAFAGHDGLVIGACKGAPLAIGFCDGATLLASEVSALASASRVAALEDGDVAVLSADGAEVFDASGAPVLRQSVPVPACGPWPHRHFMHKEIHAQPAVIGDLLARHLDPFAKTLALPPLSFDLAGVERVALVACGTSYYAAMAARSWIEDLAGVPVDIEIASEFLRRPALRTRGGLAVLVSQSGETADTLAALRLCREAGMRTLAVVNAPGSAMAREADAVLPTLAGPEVSIASTKAFTTQLVVLACFAAALGKARGVLDRTAEAEFAAALGAVPAAIAAVLRGEDAIRAVARELRDAAHMLCTGRGPAFAVALEGALKLKETSYVHAEGLALGELRHGPLAMVGEALPVVVIAPGAPCRNVAADVRALAACGARVVLVGDAAECAESVFAALPLLPLPHRAAPILCAAPMQLLAYHVAALRGLDLDRPRHLAKAVVAE